MRASVVEQLSGRRGAALALVAMVAVSTLVRAILAGGVPAPTVFNDELGYSKLAQSIGSSGRLALFDEEGPSYSPLYPTLLAPFYALGASAPTAYALAKILNAFLISLSVVPTYMIARFVLPRPHSLAAAGLALVAPLMSYSSFVMSESLAYPLCLMALWAMLAAMRSPGARGDVLLLGATLLAVSARIQLVVLVPAALTAALLVAAGRTGSRASRVAGALRAHRVLFGAVAIALVVAGIGALAGVAVSSIFGRYADVVRAGLPDPGRVLELAVQHLAGLELALGVVPFVGALVAAFAFLRAGLPERFLPFAAVAVSFTSWLILEVAIDAALFDRGADLPRIHERFMIYAIPFFIVSVVALTRVGSELAPARAYLGAAAVAAALPALIPFERVINITIGVDTFGLLPFASGDGAGYVPVPRVTIVAVVVAAALALAYARVSRRSLGLLAVNVAGLFVVVSILVWSAVTSASTFARSALPEQRDWVDGARPPAKVALVADGDALPALETAFFNLEIARVYTLCATTVGAEFGERRVTVDSTGVLRDSAGPITAAYAVVPTRLGVAGRVLARNSAGAQVLVAPAGGRLTAGPGAPADACG